MERVPLDEILTDRALAYREPLTRWPGADGLRASILRRGVLRPLLLLRDPRGLTTVAGFRRLEALRELGARDAPAEIVAGERAELFCAAVEEHAGQPASLRERVRAIAIAAELGWSTEQVGRRLLPPLGLAALPHLAEQHLRLLALPDALLDLLAAKGFSLRRCLPLCELGQADGALLASVAGALQLGGRQLEEVLTALLEIARRDGVAMARLVEELELLAGAESRAALDRLNRRRLPETWRRRDELQALSAPLAAAGAAVRFDPGLATSEVEVAVRGTDAAELCARMRRLVDDPALNAGLARIFERLDG
jgi:ParB-like chromosome segregation protein Spo0J